MLLVYHAETMAEPGAKMSTQLPKLENDARASLLVVAPTVIASPTRAGEEFARVGVGVAGGDRVGDPGGDRVATAVSSALDAPPPRLMLATAGLTRFAVTQSTPAITPDVDARSAAAQHANANRRTPLATPYVDPPTVPATWVPWPLQSLVFRPSLIASKPTNARPPNCEWVRRMPVSMT